MVILQNSMNTFGPSPLTPLFFNMISETLHNSKILHHMNTALITLIHKPNKNPTQCSSYCPIPFISTDVKIRSKAPAIRLELVIHSFKHPDQTGFIKGRLFYIIELHTNKTITKIQFPAIALTLDADAKVFDRVGWPFLFTSLNHFGFGRRFTNWIKILQVYNSPSVSAMD